VPYGEMHTKIVAPRRRRHPSGRHVRAQRPRRRAILRRCCARPIRTSARTRAFRSLTCNPSRLENYRAGQALRLPSTTARRPSTTTRRTSIARASRTQERLDLGRSPGEGAPVDPQDDPAGPVYGFHYPTSLHRLYSPLAGHGGEYFDKELTRTLIDSGSSIKALQWFIRPALQARRRAHAPAGAGPGHGGRRRPGVPDGALRHGVRLDRADR
jgi:hypothetical protein